MRNVPFQAVRRKNSYVKLSAWFPLNVTTNARSSRRVSSLAVSVKIRVSVPWVFASRAI